MITTLIAAAIAAAVPATGNAPAADGHAQHEQHKSGQHEGMDCCKHMKGETKDCCKDMAAAEKAKCCEDRAAGHAGHHKQ